MLDEIVERWPCDRTVEHETLPVEEAVGRPEIGPDTVMDETRDRLALREQRREDLPLEAQRTRSEAVEHAGGQHVRARVHGVVPREGPGSRLLDEGGDALPLEHAHPERRRVLDAGQRDRHRRVRRTVRGDECTEVEVAEHVPVEDEDRLVESGRRGAYPAGRVQRGRLGDEVHLEPVRSQQLDEWHERRGVRTDDEADTPHAGLPEAPGEPGEERCPTERQHGLGDVLGQREQPRATPSGDDQRGRRHRHRTGHRRRSPVVLRSVPLAAVAIDVAATHTASPGQSSGRR